MKDMTVVEGGTAVMECTVLGHPIPDITWFWREKEIDSSMAHFSAHFDPVIGKATLTLHDVVLEDTGMFTCVCTSHLGEASTRSYLTVKRKLGLFMSSFRTTKL